MNLEKHNTAIQARPHVEQIGHCTMILADCLDVLPNIQKCDLLLTDPPFGIGFAAQPTTGQRKRGQKRETWDNKPAEETALLLARKLCKKQVVWGGNYFELPRSRCWLSWYKPDSPPSMGNVEYAWTNLDQNSRQISHSISATNAERIGHPTQKPVRVMAWCMDQVKVTDAAVVLDPYMGSGTTAIACIRTGRKFIGIEIDPRYFKIACDRVKRELAQGLLFTPVGNHNQSEQELIPI